VLQGFADGVDHTIAGRFGAAFRATAAEGLAGKYAWGILTDEARVLIHHPAHHLRSGTNVRSGHIVARTDVLPHSIHPTAADLFLLIGREC
jgi:hypothetical protein